MSAHLTTKAKRKIEPVYSMAEEIVNSLSHGIGAALSIAGMTLLLAYAALDSDPWKIASFAIYGVTLTLLYLASTLHHSSNNAAVKGVFKVIDHCAIHPRIAGTSTPFLLVNMRGSVGWTLFAGIWGLAFAGICFKLLFGARDRILSVAI